MKNIKKIITPQNLISISVIAVGILAIFEIPQAIGIPQDKILLGLLCLLGIDSILVNIGDLEDIKTRLSEPSSSPDDSFTLRDGKFALLNYEDQTKEILMVGVALQSLIEGHIDVINHLLKRRCKVRIVLTDPKLNFLDNIDYKLGTFPGAGVLKNNLEAIILRLKTLHENLDAASKSCIELRLYQGVSFFSGVYIITKDRKNIIWVSPYAYGKSRSNRRGFLLTPDNSHGVYSYYKEVIDDLWKASDSYPLS
jgi:hypothetical protein